MSYTLTKSDGTTIVVADSAVDNATNISLIGRSSVNYGEVDNESLLHLLENFASVDSPDTNTNLTGAPIVGQLWFDIGNQVLKVWNGTSFVVAGVGSGDITPTADADSNLGAPGSRWHALYAAHGIFDTTSDTFVGDTHTGIALDTTGNALFRGVGYTFAPETTGGITLGTPTELFGGLYTNNAQVAGVLSIGTITPATIQHTTYNTNPAIIPSSGTVELGSNLSRFNATIGTLDTNIITSTAATISLGNNSDIIPANDKSSDLGDPTGRFRNIYAEDFYEDDDLGVATKLEDKYLSKLGVTNIQGTLILDNGTDNTPQLVFNVPAGAAGNADGGFMYVDMLAEKMRFIGNITAAYPGATPATPRVLMTFNAANGALELTNVNTGGIILPNNVSINARDLGGTQRQILKYSAANNIEVGNIAHPMLTQGAGATGLKYTDGATTWNVFHEGNPPTIGTSGLVQDTGDTMTGDLDMSGAVINSLVGGGNAGGTAMTFGGDEAWKISRNDGGANFAIRGGVGLIGAIDKYATTGSGAIKIQGSNEGVDGSLYIYTAATGTAGTDITYDYAHRFHNSGMTFGSNATGGLIDNGVSSGNFTRIGDSRSSSRVIIQAENSAGTGLQLQFYGESTGTPAGTDGELRCPGDIVAFASDRRLKDNVEVITSAVDKVKQLTGMTFTFNTTAKEAGFGAHGRHAGVFAQDVQAVLPEAIRKAPFDCDALGNSISGEDYLTVQYDRMIPLLIEAIKEQQLQIEELKAQISK